ncbi:hypothetical protein QWM81_19945 [Streptomyces ficellus]|uniref:Secreted protein n=1 Tax=Streptomyces ficellus TaxID=1977088 RepID=A0ABT7Z9V7_9ACTN|nr:hypothetical protein [Streptomyces ficellus]MDN3296294.1 hypothetical protein [Streptomyces ficellus]
MGGLGLIRIVRPMARVSAVATLFAALFVCLVPHGTTHAPPPVPPQDAHARGMTLAAGATEHASGYPEYTCPYDRGDCRLFPYLTPAVLTAPPLDPPPHTDGLVRPAAPDATVSRPAGSGARPRAPDLHVLQVLRT